MQDNVQQAVISRRLFWLVAAVTFLNILLSFLLPIVSSYNRLGRGTAMLLLTYFCILYPLVVVITYLCFIKQPLSRKIFYILLVALLSALFVAGRLLETWVNWGENYIVLFAYYLAWPIEAILAIVSIIVFEVKKAKYLTVPPPPDSPQATPSAVYPSKKLYALLCIVVLIEVFFPASFIYGLGHNRQVQKNSDIQNQLQLCDGLRASGKSQLIQGCYMDVAVRNNELERCSVVGPVLVVKCVGLIAKQRGDIGLCDAAVGVYYGQFDVSACRKVFANN